jgi:phosphopantetheinyl transferase (holo-ACP synthase)
MIVSTGVDLAEVERIQAALEDPRTGRRFRERVFTEIEIAYNERKRCCSASEHTSRHRARQRNLKKWACLQCRGE